MSQGKTEFKFNVNADVTLVEGVIRNWLTVNQFSFESKPGANYYAFHDPLIKGKRGFEYYINGNEVTILAYIGTFEKHQALEGFVGAVMKQDYRNEMAPLFEELKKLENGNPVNVTAATPDQQEAAVGQATTVQAEAPAGQNVPLQNSSLNTFMEQNNKKKETMVIVGFIMSIVGLLVSCLGVSFGAILIMLEFYFAIQGLKTKKKGLAIATIVLAGLGIVSFLLNIVVYILFA